MAELVCAQCGSPLVRIDPLDPAYFCLRCGHEVDPLDPDEIEAFMRPLCGDDIPEGQELWVSSRLP